METSKKLGRLELIIPGYSGHIPSSALPKESIPPTHITGGHIPGYAGYVCKIKPENLFGRTFGTITESVQVNDELSTDPLLTTTQQIFVNQNTIRQKTAAESVGVVPKRPDYVKPTPEELERLSETLKLVGHERSCPCQNIEGSNLCEKENELNNAACDFSATQSKFSGAAEGIEKRVTINEAANTISSTDSGCETKAMLKDIEQKTANCSLKGTERPYNHSSKVFIEHAIPGYCGHRRKVYADNVYGKTFKTCELIAEKLLDDAERRKNETLRANENFLPNLHRTIN